jgi:uncharacterized protein (UPF0548 family)
MFLARRPSRDVIDRFLADSEKLPLSYGPVGLIDVAVPGYDFDEVFVSIGHGRDDFVRAREALRAWTQFNLGWVEVFPRMAPVAPGTVVAVLIRHLGFWSLNGSRIVYTRGDGETRFGFAYGTLTNHAERGEELFEVTMQPDSGEVTYRIRAASRPRAALTKAGYPIARLLQARFRRDSVRVMSSPV